MKRIELAVVVVALSAAFGMVRFAAAGPADLLPNGTAPHAASGVGQGGPNQSGQRAGAKSEPTEIGTGAVPHERTFTPAPARFGNADDRRGRGPSSLEREPRPRDEVGHRESRQPALDRGERPARVERQESGFDRREPRQETVERRDRLERVGEPAVRQQRVDHVERDFSPQSDRRRDRRASEFAPRRDLDRSGPRYRQDYDVQPQYAEDRGEPRGYGYGRDERLGHGYGYDRDEQRNDGYGRRRFAAGYAPHERWVRPAFVHDRTYDDRRSRFYERDRPGYRPEPLFYRTARFADRTVRYSRAQRDAGPYSSRYGYGRSFRYSSRYSVAPISRGYAYGPSGVPSYEYNGGYTTIGTGYQGGYGYGCGIPACTCSVGYVD